jgi:hypothetical protein
VLHKRSIRTCLNKVVKWMWRRRPGGGVAQALNTHLPLLQELRSFDFKCRVGRLAIYNQYQLATSVRRQSWLGQDACVRTCVPLCV